MCRRCDGRHGTGRLQAGAHIPTVVQMGEACTGDHRLRVTFHGVRGSTPVHDEATHRYGGNTSCVSLAAPGESPLMFDLGTGARYFGRGLGHGAGHGSGHDAGHGAGHDAGHDVDQSNFVGHCLLTHLHWDHVLGLPFFGPMLRAGARLQIFGPRQDDGRTVDAALRSIVTPPMFPIDLDVLPAQIDVVDVGDDDFSLGGYSVSSRFVPHRGSTVGYRVTWNGRSVCYISDHQQPDGEMTIAAGVRELVSGVDLLIHDAQFTDEEFERKRDWGHCTIDFAIWVAEQCDVGTLALFHHDPAHHDDMLDDLAARHASSGAVLGDGPRIVVAHEGMSLEL